ncbi:MAG: DUF1631 family protein [Pseudomonadales bacterium]|nr:DUF1631 family protein [Pseudomonadales bacterium]
MTSRDALIRALENRYHPLTTEGTSTSPDATGSTAEAVTPAIALKQFLADLPVEQTSRPHLLLQTLKKQHPDWHLSHADFAVLASVDDCSRLIFRLINLHEQADGVLRSLMPVVARELLEDPLLAIDDNPSLLDILDLFGEAMIGWTPGLGRFGDQLFSRLQEVADQLSNSRPEIPALRTELQSFLHKDQERIHKIEDRLAASETGQIRTRQSRNLAASMLNSRTRDKQLTRRLQSFLQGPWYESLPLIILAEGITSEAWQRAVKLTETMIELYQPLAADAETASSQKQLIYRLIENLPNEIREMLVALEHDTQSAELALDELEQEHILIVSGQPLAYEPFSELPCDEQAQTGTTISRPLLRKVQNLQTGQWLLFQNGTESHRLKLALKLEDIQAMMFTNRNGMKVMEKSFDEVAYLMSTGIMKLLNHEAVFSSTFRTHYEGLVEEHTRQIRRTAERRAEFEQEMEAREASFRREEEAAREREQARLEAMQAEKEAFRTGILASASAAAALPENAEALSGATEQIKKLGIGSWLYLPAPENSFIEAKLAVILSAGSKYIFVDSKGTKLADYSGTELSQMLVAGLAKIHEKSVVFEDTLAQVVSKLRQDRNKSYDDLTAQ